MSEADYMDECQHADRWDDENRTPFTYEVIDWRNRVVYLGSRSDCWAWRRKFGGFVREALD